MEGPFKLATAPLDVTPAGIARLPYFLLDLGPNFFTELPITAAAPRPAWGWRVVVIASLSPADLTLLGRHGYGAISYGWGPHQPAWPAPRLSYDPATEPTPTFPTPADTWLVPKIASYPTSTGPSGGVATIQQSLDFNHVRNVFRTMQKRFVWWDHICIPQPDARLGQGAGQIVALSPSLADRREREVDKQKDVYRNADVGAIWMHQVTWRTNDPFDVSAILRKAAAQPLTDLNKFRDNLNFGTLPTMVDGSPRSMLDAVLGKPSGVAAWRTAITNFLQTLNKIKAQEYWFRSLWCFQEGALLQKQALLDYEGKLLNLDGTQFEPNKAGYQFTFPDVKNAKQQTVNAPCLLHITGCTTLLSNMAATVLANPSKDNKAAVQEILDIYNDAANNGPAFLKDVRRQLGDSGLMFYFQNSPLEMLASARSSRAPSREPLDAYYAMTGVLGLNDRILRANYSAAEPLVRRQFFEAIMEQYQWPTLLLAKSVRDPETNWGSVSIGNFEPIGDFVGGKFAARDTPVPGDQYKISYNSNTDEVVINPPADGLMNIICWKPTAGEATLLELDPTKIPTPTRASDISFTPITFPPPASVGEWRLLPFRSSTASGDKGFDVSPFKPADWKQPKVSNAQCLYIENWNAATNTGRFRGIVNTKDIIVGAPATWQLPAAVQVKLKWA